MSKIDLQKISINIDQQSTLARLLAQENINVIHGNYRTAWFDPEKRVLALPIWKNRGKAVYDLLTGHEVGHALFTPSKGWHDAVDDIQGAPKAYLNVLEDVRIERKIQDRYPGLRAQFKKAYKVLSDEDFFGINGSNTDIDELILIDRINLKSKLGDNIDVTFIGVETEYFARAYKTETFEDVVNLAKEIYQYQKTLYDQKVKQEEESPRVSLPNADESNEEYDGSDPSDYHKDPNQQKADSDTDMSDQPEESSDDGNDPTSIKRGDSEVEQKELESKNGINTPAPKDKSYDDSLNALDAITDKAFRKKESDLTSNDTLNGTLVYTLNKVKDNDIIIDYKEYYNNWNDHLNKLDSWQKSAIEEYTTISSDKFKKFKHDTEAAGAYMAKEFELRKAAYQYSRSSINKTGIINTNKLHAYKYSEDIFLKSTKLANYKNHGMMMFIDFSGSMQENIGATIRQILNLTTFCKMVNIPYEVYAFTTRVKYDDEEKALESKQDWKTYADCEVIPQKFNLLNLVSSRMSRSEYQQAFKMLWTIALTWDGNFPRSYINSWNELHSTPLNSCIAYATEIISAYKAKHSIQKMITMFLTDGESDSFQVRMTDEGESHRTDSTRTWKYRESIMRFAGDTITVKNMYSPEVTSGMLKILKKNTDSTVLGFFISQYRNEAVTKVCNATSYSLKDHYVDQMNKNKAIIRDDIFGYDRYFGLCQKYLDIVEDEFGEMVEDGASKSKIKTAFAKMTKAKRVNRVLLNAFVDSIA